MPPNGLSPARRASHLLDGDLLPRGAVAHLDDVAARAVPEVAQQLKVVDRRLHAHAVQLQQAVLQETEGGYQELIHMHHSLGNSQNPRDTCVQINLPQSDKGDVINFLPSVQVF